MAVIFLCDPLFVFTPTLWNMPSQPGNHSGVGPHERERVTVSVLDTSPGVFHECVFVDAFCSSALYSRDLTSATSSLSVTLAAAENGRCHTPPNINGQAS